MGVGSNNDAFAITQFGVVPEGPQIIDISQDSATGTVSITWTSEADVLYAVSRSTDLLLWDDIEDSAVGQDGTTTFEDNPEEEVAIYRVSRTPLVP